MLNRDQEVTKRRRLSESGRGEPIVTVDKDSIAEDKHELHRKSPVGLATTSSFGSCGASKLTQRCPDVSTGEHPLYDKGKVTMPRRQMTNEGPNQQEIEVAPIEPLLQQPQIDAAYGASVSVPSPEQRSLGSEELSLRSILPGVPGILARSFQKRALGIRRRFAKTFDNDEGTTLVPDDCGGQEQPVGSEDGSLLPTAIDSGLPFAISAPRDPKQGVASSFAQSLEDNGFELVDKDQPCCGGGYSDIFRARHKTHGFVAVKRPRLNEYKYLQSLKSEEKIWKDLNHRHILPLLASITNGMQVYLISPLFPMNSAPKYVKENPDTNRRKLVGQLASAIGYLYSKGIVHGDIKGENTLVSSEGGLVVCDFGLSKSLKDGMTTDPLMKRDGSTYWQAPELLGSLPSDAADDSDVPELDVKKTFATDVYAFGIAIYEILTGKSPYNGEPHIVAFSVSVRGKRPPMEPKTSPSGETYSQLWEIASWC